jgi:hypothetical protein
MLRFRRAKRVRLHPVDQPGVNLPSFEGLLVSKPFLWRHEYVLAVPQLVTEAVVQGGLPTVLDSRLAVIPADRVLFYEYL